MWKVRYDHGIAGIAGALNEKYIHVITSENGIFLDDIDSREDNARTSR